MKPKKAPPAPTSLFDPVCNWEGRNLALLLPWYKTVNPITALGLLAMVDRLKMGVIMAHGDAYIAHARDTLAQQFLDKTVCDWALMIDDDMILPFGNAAAFNAFTGFNFPAQFAGMHTMNRLLSHQKTLVGGLYFGRQVGGLPMYGEGVSLPDEAAAARKGPVDVVKPTRWVATGCMLVHRQVFLDIDEKYPELKRRFFSPGEADLVGAAKKASVLLSQGDTHAALVALNEGLVLANSNSPTGLGEDVTFCVRAAAAGHQPYVDMGLVCGHAGQKIYGPGVA